MNQPDQTIGLLVTHPEDRRLLEALLAESGRRVRVEASPAALQDARLIIADEAAGTQHAQALAALKHAQDSSFLPVLIALPHQADSAPWLKAGFDDILRLPLSAAELAARLEVFLHVRAQTEAKLRATERRFQALLENISDGITLLDGQGKILYRSPSAARLSGYSETERQGASVFELIHPDDLPQAKGVMAGLLQAPGSTHTLQYRSLHKDGTWHWLEAVATNLLHEPSVGALVANFRDITGRKQAEEVQRQAKANLRQIIDLIPHSIFAIDRQGRLIFANQRLAELVGAASPEALVNRPQLEWTPHQAQAAGYLQDDLEVITTGKIKFIPEEIYVDHRGEEHVFQTTKVPYVPVGGEETVVLGIGIEITAIKRAEAAVRSSQEQLQLITDTAPVYIAYCDTGRRFKFVNNRYAERFGLTRGDIVGRTIPEVLGEQAYHAIQPYIDAALAGQPVEFEIEVPYASLGTHFMRCAYVPDLGEEGEVRGLVAVISDVTERKRAEEARARLAAIVESSEDAIVSYTLQGVITSWNASAARAYGYTADEAVGQPVFMLAPPERAHEMPRIIEQIQQGAQFEHFETVRLRKDGQAIDVAVTVSPIKDDAGQIVGVSAITRDITERKRAEEALQAKDEELRAMTQQLWQTAKLATMGELVAGIAHELNNPLATVSLRTEALMRQIPPGDPKRRALEIVAQEVERMSGLVNNLLQSGRNSHSDRSFIDVRQELEKTLELMHYHLQDHRIRLVKDFAPAVPPILADRQQLRQVFLNLFTNASDAMPRGGTLTIRIGVDAPAGSARQVSVEVVDTGRGIPAEALPRIWDAFYTTKPEGRGTGLGLAICRRIVEEHRGTIGLTSEPEQGTRVLVRFPAMQR